MKLLSSAVMAVFAAQYAEAQVLANTRETEIYVPYDCVNESHTTFGQTLTATKVSDRDYIAALSTTAQISAITGCYDKETKLITGIQALWRDGTSSEAQGANVGKQSGTYEWSDKKRTGKALEMLEKYYHREASPDTFDWYTSVLTNVSNSSVYNARLDDAWTKSDVDGTSGLSWEEFQVFYMKLREPQAYGDKNYYVIKDDTASGDYGSGTSSNTAYKRDEQGFAQTNQLEKMYGAWEAMGAKATVSKGDFTSLEQIIGSWIKAGKITETGFAYDHTAAQSTSDTNASAELRYVCKTFDLDPHDYVTRMKVVTNKRGVVGVNMQSLKHANMAFGIQDSFNVGGTTNRYAFEREDWRVFED
jgi:hypothetical protein